MTEATLSRLLDRNAIVDVLSCYARGIDRRDAALLRSCFTDVLDVNMGGVQHRAIAAEAWVEQTMKLIAGYQTTQHIISNHLVELEDDRAVCRAEVQAQHWNPDGAWLLGGRYEDGLVRTADGWRIDRLALHIGWTETTGKALRPGQRRSEDPAD